MKQVKEIEEFPQKWLAQHAKRAMDSVVPLICSEKLSPVQGILLAFMVMDFNIVGEKTRVSAHEAYEGVLMIMKLWQMGAFQPSPCYPHTREQVVADLEKEEPHLPPVKPDSYWSLHSREIESQLRPEGERAAKVIQTQK